MNRFSHNRFNNPTIIDSMLQDSVLFGIEDAAHKRFNVDNEIGRIALAGAAGGFAQGID